MSLTPKLPRSAWTARPSGSRRRSGERRDLERVPLALFVDEYVEERPHRAMTTNVSASGLYLHRVASPRSRQFGRPSRHVQIELALPGTSDTIWARGEIRYDEIGDDLVHGTGVELVGLARGHQRLLGDYLYEHRRRRLTEILELIRRNRYH